MSFNFYAALCNNSAWPPLCTFRAVIGFWSMVIVGFPLACTKFRGQENDIRALVCSWLLETLWNGGVKLMRAWCGYLSAAASAAGDKMNVARPQAEPRGGSGAGMLVKILFAK